jgi:hypothetical protein
LAWLRLKGLARRRRTRQTPSSCAQEAFATRKTLARPGQAAQLEVLAGALPPLTYF